ncbi:MAG: type II secretion system F family protein, partial [Chitinivibrionales bacterium]|nr:type II secretion system F family protein [Chitinivibrionales bacterium]
MPTYFYRGVTSSNSEVKGEIQATNRNEAISLLRKKKIRTLALYRKPPDFSLKIGSTVKLSDVSRFTRQFSAMTSAGLPLVQIMDILSNQTENKVLASAIRQISSDIQGGSSLAESMSKHPKVFNSLYCSMVASGESSGTLDEVLLRLAEYQEKAFALERKVKGAMTYPVIVFTVAIIATILMLTFVIPKFAEMFMDLGGELPLPTKIVMGASEFLQKYFALLIVGAFGIVVGFTRYYKTPQGALAIDGLVLKLPIFGEMQRKSSISRFAQTLSTLLNSGVSILNALTITAKTAGNKVIEKAIFLTVERISGGHSIAEPLSETGLFPPMVIHMIAVGE